MYTMQKVRAEAGLPSGGLQVCRHGAGCTAAGKQKAYTAGAASAARRIKGV